MKRLKIFISSVQKEFGKERKALINDKLIQQDSFIVKVSKAVANEADP